MFSYGQRPYENLQARQVPQALEKGERLPQPDVCTIDVYMILIKCKIISFTLSSLSMRHDLDFKGNTLDKDFL